jgi:accessory secretory protein Asp3
MLGEKWIVYWNEYSSDTYLYGSEINYHKRNCVEFKNNLMPSGTVIKQWYSKTNYQKQKIEPALPMIDGESEYQMTVNIECMDKEAWLLRIIFFDRYEVEAGSIYVRDNVINFKCPIRTYSYRLQLINGGMTWFHFHSIIIQEILNGKDEDNKKAE